HGYRTRLPTILDCVGSFPFILMIKEPIGRPSIPPCHANSGGGREAGYRHPAKIRWYRAGGDIHPNTRVWESVRHRDNVAPVRSTVFQAPPYLQFLDFAATR